MTSEPITAITLPEKIRVKENNEKCSPNSEKVPVDENMSYIMDIKTDDKIAEKNRSLLLYLFVLVIFAMANLFWFCWLSWQEHHQVSVYKLVHVNIIETDKADSCDDDSLSSLFSCLVAANPHQDLDLPKCSRTGLNVHQNGSQDINWDDLLDIIQVLKQADSTKFVDVKVGLGTKTLGVVGSRIVAVDSIDLDIRLVQMSVCLGAVTGYVTMIDGVMNTTNKTIRHYLQPEQIFDFAADNTLQISKDLPSVGKKNTSSNMNKGSRINDIEWIPCMVTQDDINCRGSNQFMPTFSFFLNKSQDEYSEVIDSQLLGNILTKISNKGDEFRKMSQQKALSVLDRDIVNIFFELFEIPVVKKKFSYITNLLLATRNSEKSKVDLITKFIYGRNLTSFDVSGIVPPGWDWTKWSEKNTDSWQS